MLDYDLYEKNKASCYDVHLRRQASIYFHVQFIQNSVLVSTKYLRIPFYYANHAPKWTKLNENRLYYDLYIFPMHKSPGPTCGLFAWVINK